MLRSLYNFHILLVFFGMLVYHNLYDYEENSKKIVKMITFLTFRLAYFIYQRSQVTEKIFRWSLKSLDFLSCGLHD